MFQSQNCSLRALEQYMGFGLDIFTTCTQSIVVFHHTKRVGNSVFPLTGPMLIYMQYSAEYNQDLGIIK